MPNDGYVYFILSGSGDVKIGYSERPGRRLDQLQTGRADRLSLLAAFPGTAQLEADLHRRFAEHRKCGEWFSPAPEIFAWVVERIGELARPRPTSVVTPAPSAPMPRRDALRAVRELRATLAASKAPPLPGVSDEAAE
jgi:hypothetical protein